MKMVNRNNSNIHVDIKTLPEEEYELTNLVFTNSDGEKTLSNLKNKAKFIQNGKKYKYFKEFMLSMAAHYQISKAKSEDVKEAVRKFKQATRKPVKAGLNYESFDHFYHLTMNFSKLNGTQKTAKRSYMDKMRERNHHKVSELERYVRSRIDYTFMIPETEQIVCNLGYILKSLINQMICQKRENLGLTAVHFGRVNSYIEETLNSNKLKRSRFYGSKNTL